MTLAASQMMSASQGAQSYEQDQSNNQQRQGSDAGESQAIQELGNHPSGD